MGTIPKKIKKDAFGNVGKGPLVVGKKQLMQWDEGAVKGLGDNF